MITARMAVSLNPSGSHACGPLVDLTFSLIPRDPVSFLNLADQLVAFASGLIKIVIGQFAPVLFGLTGELFPFALDSIPVHVITLSFVALPR
jgi:hypothetical protein